MQKTNDIVPSLQLPVKQSQRKVTDCCCTVIGMIFALIMFLIASLIWDQDEIVQIIEAISGNQHSQCAIGEYIYFENAMSFYAGICMKTCPMNDEGKNIGICQSADDRSKDYTWKNKILETIYKNEGFVQTLFYTFVIAFGWGMLRMTVTHWLPRYVPIMSYVLGTSLLLLFAVITLATQLISRFLGKWNLVFGISLILLALILIVMLYMYSRELKFQGYMLEYSVKFLNYNSLTFITVPIFILLHIGLLAFVFWQYLCFSSEFVRSITVWKLTLSEIFYILILIEYLWSLQFLRDAFNFCVSGNVVDWYWTGNSSLLQSWSRLVRKNWGSVVGGSFLNCFFQIPTLLAELIVCHPGTCCSTLGDLCYNKFSVIPCFFELVRTDAYSFINLTGLPFCESARRCSRLCENSNQFVGYHSAMKHHRLGAHIASVSFVFMWACWILMIRTTHFQLLQHLAVLLFVIYGTVTWFIGIHIDVAQSLQTCYLTEFEIMGDYQKMQHLLPFVKKILQPIQNRVQGDGNC